MFRMISDQFKGYWNHFQLKSMAKSTDRKTSNWVRIVMIACVLQGIGREMKKKKIWIACLTTMNPSKREIFFFLNSLHQDLMTKCFVHKLNKLTINPSEKKTKKKKNILWKMTCMFKAEIKIWFLRYALKLTLTRTFESQENVPSRKKL